MLNALPEIYATMNPPIIVQTVSDDSVALWSGLGGAVLGALVSGVISWVLARQTSKQQLARDSEQRRETEKSQALKAVIKLQAILNALHDTKRTIDGMLTSAEEQGYGDIDLWQKAMPISGLPKEPISFDPQDIVVLFAAQKHDIANDLTLMSSRWASLLENMKDYNRLRTELVHSIPTDRMEGDRGTFVLNAGQIAMFGPRMHVLNNLMAQVMENLEADLNNGFRVANEMGPALRTYLNDNKFPIVGRAQPAEKPEAPDVE
ncbi:hypothetical protein GFB56_05530 [Ensifer sp. T173]|uniref:Uncharacterized protein n=1 Tax=Ensifer canadensis TaxID=555315 RepID=A0AAW4FGG5_9HYPH|nr:hypothetical protein [Ensifer canadensis]MBM3090274.1 hypothetical protein [Ensifer canadensis]UBI75807.1 hypothetical protein J3R84_01205 [Ensifer canadensis]